MADGSNLISCDIDAYLQMQENKSLLRFLTCGSVDDGKSTLIGRLLFDANAIFEDQLAALEKASKKVGTQGANTDFALLVDGLASEREQGITIDVAYRYFSTEKRKFIVADTPGHEQYTRNMATGASTADLAIILIDARKGVLIQTKRHSYIVSLLGVQNVVVAINKMDLVDFSQEIYQQISADYNAFARGLGAKNKAPFNIVPIPVCALKGDNVIEKSSNMAWYKGPALLQHLETVAIQPEETDKPFRMSVQWVNRPNLDFRGFCGQVSSGTINTGDTIKVLPSAQKSRIKSVLVGDAESTKAIVGQSITLILEDEIDISRGDMITETRNPAEVADQFEVVIVWMAEEAMLPGRSYLIKIGSQNAQATITKLKYGININTLQHVPAKNLALNEIGTCNISLDRNIAFDPYEQNHDTGGFILIDRLTNATIAMGTIRFALRRSSNIHWQSMEVSKKTHSDMKGQKPVILWFTGLSGSGKSTIANIIEKKLNAMSKHTCLLDGDNIRHGLNKDLGFTDADRVESIRRIAEVSKLMVNVGLITLVSFISPFRSERRMAREMMDDGEFLEIYLDTPLEVAEQRDVKGLYKKARAGEIKNFTGIDSPYEPPHNPDITIKTIETSAEDAAEVIIARLRKLGIVEY